MCRVFQLVARLEANCTVHEVKPSQLFDALLCTPEAGVWRSVQRRPDRFELVEFRPVEPSLLGVPAVSRTTLEVAPTLDEFAARQTNQQHSRRWRAAPPARLALPAPTDRLLLEPVQVFVHDPMTSLTTRSSFTPRARVPVIEYSDKAWLVDWVWWWNELVGAHGLCAGDLTSNDGELLWCFVAGQHVVAPFEVAPGVPELFDGPDAEQRAVESVAHKLAGAPVCDGPTEAFIEHGVRLGPGGEVLSRRFELRPVPGHRELLDDVSVLCPNGFEIARVPTASGNAAQVRALDPDGMPERTLGTHSTWHLALLCARDTLMGVSTAPAW